MGVKYKNNSIMVVDMNWPLRVAMLASLVLSLLLPATLAMQPITVPLEIRNNTNGILNNTQLTINFTFFSESTAGILLYNETQTLITDSNGRLFPIINTTGLQGNTTVWLEINISNQMITPRFRITGALYAENAERLQNQTRTTGLTLGNISLQGNLSHTVSGLLINSTGSINASAIMLGNLPASVLFSFLNRSNTWNNTQIWRQTGTLAFQFQDGSAQNTLTVNTLDRQVLINDIPTGGIWPNTLFAIFNTAGNQEYFSVNSSGTVNISAQADKLIVGTTSLFYAPVNITSQTAGDLVFNIFNLSGSAITSINTGTTGAPQHHFFSSLFNITLLGGSNVLQISNTIGESIFRINSNGAGIVTTGGTLNVTNLTAGGKSGALLINNTGGINASAVGFGTIPQGVTQVYNDTGFTGGRVVFGKATGIVHASNGAEVIVNMSTGFSCTACYSVVASMANSTQTVGTFIIINMNASQFNLTYRAGAAPEFMNASWIAVGY